MALQPGQAARGWLWLNQAQTWDDFVKAMRLIEAPQLNVAYADSLGERGNIGYWCTGRVPIRAQGKGDVPVPGWTGEYEWIGEVPFEEMPHALNPQQGYIVTCNHRLVPDDYPHFLGEVWMNGYRARRLVDMLKSKGQLSIDDMRVPPFRCLPGVGSRSAGDLQSTDRMLRSRSICCASGWLSTAETVGGRSGSGALHTGTQHSWQLLSKSLTVALGYFHPLMTASEFYGHDTATIL
jgi:penicillin amidase